MKHLVQFSTGLSSAEVAWRLVEKHGRGDVILLTADTTREHPDNWRFGHQVADRLRCGWTILRDGRTPMEAGRDRKCVPNNRMAVCSQILKRELLRAEIDARYDPAGSIVYIGYDWSEPNRIASAARFWSPWIMSSPLADEPPKLPLGDLFRSRGIEPPELYKYNLPHANCGGFCVRGGQAAWEAGLRRDRATYLEWEAEEEESRRVLGKDVAILRDRSGMATHGHLRPLTLRAFRERLDRQPGLFDADDWGACGCDPPEPLPGGAAVAADGARRAGPDRGAA